MPTPRAQLVPRMLATDAGKKPGTAPPGRCACGAKLSVYRSKARTPSGWQEQCSPCTRRDFDAAVRADQEHRRNRHRRIRMSYAQAPVKTALRLPSAAWQREIQPGLEDLGFTYLGEDSQGHAIFQHATAGQVRLSKTPGGDKAESVRQAFGRARRLLAIQQSEAGEFLTHLRDLYGILPHESKKLRLNLVEEINQWAKTAKPRMNLGTLRSALRESPFLEVPEPAKGARRLDYIIHGAQALDPDTGQLRPGIVVDADDVQRARDAFLARVAKTGGAVAWLATLLDTEHAVKAPDVEDQANRAGFPWNAVKRAADELGVIYEKEPIYQGSTYWRLPAPPEIADHPAAAALADGDTVTVTVTVHDPPAPVNPAPVNPAEAPPPPEPPTQPEPSGEKQQVAPPPTVPAAAPGDLLAQITSLVERAARADTAEAKVAIAADELRAVVTLCTSLAQSADQLRIRCEAALEVVNQP